MRTNRIRILISLIVVALVLTACQDKDLQTLSKALDDSAHGVAVLQMVVIEANDQHLITDDAARPIMEFSVKVNSAGQDAVAIARNLNSIDPVSRQKLLTVLAPVIQVLANGQTLGNAITDAGVHQKVTAAMSLIQVALNSAQLVLAVN